MVKDLVKDPKALIKKPGIKIMKESSAKNQNLKTNDFRTVFIRCDCDSEILVANYDGEFDMLDLCIYETRTSLARKMTLWEKFRYVYQLFRYGQPYTDQIILNKKQINELKGFLDNI